MIAQTLQAPAILQGLIVPQAAQLARVRLLPLQSRLGRLPLFTAVLGLASDGAPLLLHLPGPKVGHVLISGAPGAGKTVLAQAIILSLAMANRRSQLMFVLVDPGQRAFRCLDKLPHLLWPVVRQVGDVASALDELVGLAEVRGKAVSPRIVLVLDGLEELVQAGGKGVSDALVRLTQRGQAAGVHVVACTRTPLPGLPGPLVQAHFPVRLVGKLADAREARLAAGIADSGAESLAGQGDFVAVAAGAMTRFQAACTTAAEARRVASRLRNGQRDRPVGGQLRVLAWARDVLRVGRAKRAG